MQPNPEDPPREHAPAELVDGGPAAPPGPDGIAAPDGQEDVTSEQITSPAKLIRIASMVRTMLDEVRRAPLDDAGRRRLREIHERSLRELEVVLSPDLRQELAEVVLPFSSDDPTESELRLAQAQLVGWLEGLFHGIQATLFTQQAMAQSQFEEMRRRRALDARRHRPPRRPRAERLPVTATTTWSPGSWRDRPTAQQPDWPDDHEVEQTLDELRTMPPLVFAGEARSLTEALGAVSERRGFVLQAGDCAESFAAFSADAIRDKLKVILQMAVVLTYGSGVPTVKIGRMAGQFAKPRSSPTETRDDVELPSYRGDLVNDFVFDPIARRADPSRLVRAYNQSAATLNLVRAFTKGGFADLSRVHAWNLEYIATSPEGRRYEVLAAEIERALRFMGACGIDLAAELQLHQVDFYTSHEALILGYEEALTRRDSLTDTWYDCSAHLVWLGDRTRQLDGAHVEFLAGVENPVGVKLGPDRHPRRRRRAVRSPQSHPPPGSHHAREPYGRRTGRHRAPTLAARGVGERESGRLDLRPDARQHVRTRERLQDPQLRRRDRRAARVLPACDTADVWPGGVHVELTGEDVTECLGGSDQILGDHLEQRYETLCDPRLNARQSLELAFQVAELLRR